MLSDALVTKVGVGLFFFPLVCVLGFVLFILIVSLFDVLLFIWRGIFNVKGNSKGDSK